MRLVTFRPGAGRPRAGLVTTRGIADLAQVAYQLFPAVEALPDDLLVLLQREGGLDQVAELYATLEKSNAQGLEFWPVEEVQLCAPILRPGALLDFYTFEQHVSTCRAKRGLGVVPEWYRYPVYYNGNPRAVIGDGEAVPFPPGESKRDYELELAVVIGKKGRDISEAEADSYIAGYTVMNDWSARSLQAQIMAVGLGPAKAKDFATSLGPCLVTPDSIGDPRNLTMLARVNGEEWSRGNSGSSHYTFAQMIAFASEGVTLYPGDVIGSGTVGTGCGLELDRFLQPGDEVELEIENIGVLRNTVI
ncbi:MAG: fumarylacetoacetate hydrolase family protein [Candidatus Sericytochromatia bacterium]